MHSERNAANIRGKFNLDLHLTYISVRFCAHIIIWHASRVCLTIFSLSLLSIICVWLYEYWKNMIIEFYIVLFHLTRERKKTKKNEKSMRNCTTHVSFKSSTIFMYARICSILFRTANVCAHYNANWCELVWTRLTKNQCRTTTTSEDVSVWVREGECECMCDTWITHRKRTKKIYFFSAYAVKTYKLVYVINWYCFRFNNAQYMLRM